MLKLCAFSALLMAIGAACAGHRGTCEAVPDTYIRAGSEPVYRSCAVNRPVKGPYLGSTFNYPKLQNCGRARIEFVVSSIGVPDRGSARVISGNDTRLGEEMILFLASLRYDPARRNGQDVAQLTTWERSYTVRQAQKGAGRGPAAAQSSAPKC